MGEAYTPGLSVIERTVIRQERHLPLPGKVLVASGAKVDPDTIVARTELPGQVELLNIANALGVDPKEVKRLLLKQEGDKVEVGEVVAKAEGLFGLFKSECKSPISGILETVSEVTGKATLRKGPIPVVIRAFLGGEVDSVIPGEGVIIRSWGSRVQGIFGIGGETWGPLRIGVSSRTEVLDEAQILESFAAGIVMGGSYVTLAALRKAVKLGVKGMIVGGIDDQDLREFLGYDLGIAITGREEKGFTLILTEGFGKIEMAERTFQLLESAGGRIASINGRTQIRAGVIRPEILIPYLDEKIPSEQTLKAENVKKLSIGSKVRIIRQPHFGEVAQVLALPPEPQLIETEAKTRVVEVSLENGKRWILPRANVELVES